MRWNIRENVLLIHITSSFIKANIQWWVWWHKTDSFKCMHLTLSQVHQLAQWPDPSTLEKNHQQSNTLKSCVSQNKPINYSAKKSFNYLSQIFLSTTEFYTSCLCSWVALNETKPSGIARLPVLGLLRSEPASAPMKPLHFWRASPATEDGE